MLVTRESGILDSPGFPGASGKTGESGIRVPVFLPSPSRPAGPRRPGCAQGERRLVNRGLGSRFTIRGRGFGGLGHQARATRHNLKPHRPHRPFRGTIGLTQGGLRSKHRDWHPGPWCTHIDNHVTAINSAFVRADRQNPFPMKQEHDTHHRFAFRSPTVLAGRIESSLGERRPSVLSHG